MMYKPAQASEPIPGYVVQERIGVGGYGEVWSCQAPGGVPKAIKFVYGYFDDDRAARELKALNRIKQVRHPFLLSLERFEVVDGQLVIVTELADMSLKDRYEQVKATGAEGIARAELLGYLRDAAEALDYMSENYSLQHLDVKPENLLLVGGRVKVADFGLVKELHDATASLMGGLTPVYAPPEVFDGLPNKHSDQYSLAIVFQEMLTGSLPFPGRTPAQLAAQHLHARPRIASLPAHDQAVIAKALSKNPQARYETCRELIECLLAADRPAQVAAAPEPQPKRAGTSGDTTSVKSAGATSDTDSQTHIGGVKPAKGASSDELKTQVVRDRAQSRGGGQARPLGDALPLDAAQEIVDLGPIDLEGQEHRIRPTLFVGIGGTAARTLRHLRRKLCDRFASCAPLPMVEMLLVDTDTKKVYEATQGEPGTALLDQHALALPLRSAQEYTSDPRNMLSWLSRRWLYNIPRSLETEGRRPLGRLAFVDHAPVLKERLKNAIAKITSPEARTAFEQTTGMAAVDEAPRIYIVASTAGGTGGGMVLDAAYAIRQVLAELGHADEGLCGILTHSTDRNPAASDLATANTYACLSELDHYTRAGAYPGDSACDLMAMTAEHGPFEATYFVDLGDGLNDRQFDQATDAVASYIYLDAMTPAGAALEASRALTSLTLGGSAVDTTTNLRTFGVSLIGSSQTALVPVAAELLCQGVVDLWRGADKSRLEEPSQASFVELATQHEDVSLLPIETDRLAAEHAARLQLAIEPLSDRLGHIVENELGGSPHEVLTKIRSTLGSTPEASTAAALVPHLLQTLENLFGPPMPEEEFRKPSNLPLRVALEKDLKELATPWADAIHNWILELVENPASRLGGACRAKDWYADHLRDLESEALQALKDLLQHCAGVQNVLLALAQAPPPKPKLFGGRRSDTSAADLEAACLRLISLRYEEMTWHALCRIVRTLTAQTARAGDQLKELHSSLGRLAQQFDGATSWEDLDRAEEFSGVFAEVRRAVAAALRRKMPQLAQNVDERFQEECRRQHTGLRRVWQKGDAMRAQVPAELRADARAEVIAALKDIPFAEALLGSTSTAEERLERLQTCRDAARPKLVGCGGAQRLLAIVPASASDSNLQATIASDLTPTPTVLSDADADLVFCFEQQDLALPYVAGRLVEERDDFVQIAGRLHVRSDVEWSPIAQAAHACAAH